MVKELEVRDVIRAALAHENNALLSHWVWQEGEGEKKFLVGEKDFVIFLFFSPSVRRVSWKRGEGKFVVIHLFYKK